MRSISRIRLYSTAIAIAAVSMFACSDDNDDDVTGPNADIVASIQTDPQIMAAMHQSNVGEITAGQLALQKASNASVKSFAQMMITDHTAMDQQGTALAAQLGITPVLPDQRLPQLQAQETATLTSTAAGTTFDRVYIAQQITAHERTLALVDASLNRATRNEIKTLLQTGRPKIVSHLDMARTIQATVGTP
jgi:putative membrane protein